MTTQNERGQDKPFVRAVLPWLIAAGAFIVYLITLNPWVSFANLASVARVTGQAWTPELTRPLFYLVTAPFRWLPETWAPAGLNLFSAVCAALTLALLARSVMLLPHDRTHEQRLREQSEFSLLSIRSAWIPPVLAVAVCGLQLSFWENATAGASAMFQLLLFAYVVRCLLEYRISERDSWLLRAAVVYGAGMTGNWVMVGLLPAFLAAVIWIKGTDFFDLGFLGKMLLCGVAGLLLYLLLPLVYVVSGGATASFWQALKFNLGGEKNVLFLVARGVPKSVLLLLATTSLLPILLIGIRWSSYFGDQSKLGITLTTTILHVAHAAFLGACIWVAFDPMFSPRHRGFVIPELYYLGALSVGYFAGYFLVVYRPLPDRPARRTPASQKLLNPLAQAAVWALVVLVPAGLLYKNIPLIRVTNGPAVQRYAALLTQNLPQRGVILSDDATRLLLAQSWMARDGKAKDCIFLDTQALPSPVYYDWQQKQHPDEWLPSVPASSTNPVPDVRLIQLLAKLSENNPVYYLHPSFGYYFEFFYPQPHGLVMELGRYATNDIAPPALTPAQIAANNKFWSENRSALTSLLPAIQAPAPDQSGGFRQWFMRKLHIPFEPNATALAVGGFYSQALDAWAVALQRAGHLNQAGRDFETALALNANNVAAKSNLALNHDLQARRPPAVESVQSIREELGNYRSWQQLLQSTGPFDDPTHCFLLGLTYAGGRLYREAVQQFERVHELAPDYAPASMWLAQFYAARFPAKSLSLLAGIEAHPDAMQQAGIQPLRISITKATALFADHRASEADQILQDAMAENPTNQVLLATVAQLSTMYGRFSNALSAIGRELKIAPNDPVALVAEGYLNLQTGNYEHAIPPLTRALTLDTNNHTARFDRAIAYLRSGKLDEAQADYQALRKVYPRAFQVYYGLGEIAWREKDTNAAIHYYQLYMSNCIPDSAEAKDIGERLKTLMARSP